MTFLVFSPHFEDIYIHYRMYKNLYLHAAAKVYIHKSCRLIIFPLYSEFHLKLTSKRKSISRAFHLFPHKVLSSTKNQKLEQQQQLLYTYYPLSTYQLYTPPHLALGAPHSNTPHTHIHTHVHSIWYCNPGGRKRSCKEGRRIKSASKAGFDASFLCALCERASFYIPRDAYSFFFTRARIEF